MNLNVWLHIQELRVEEISQELRCDRNKDDIQVV